MLATLRSTSNDRNSLRNFPASPGLFALLRFDAYGGREFGITFNTSTTTITNQMEVDPNRVQIPALDFIACEAGASQ
jgi:hypothetical protein